MMRKTKVLFCENRVKDFIFFAVFLSIIVTFQTLYVSAAEKQSFFTPEINELIEKDQMLIEKQGYGNLIIPAELNHFSNDVIPENAMYVAEKLHNAGYEAYFVGGCIRDYILGTNSMDYDVTTNASYDQATEIFGDAFHLHYVGEVAYGGVDVNGEAIDLATYSGIPEFVVRSPWMPEYDERSLLTDSFQRDLTFNALYYDPFSQNLYDFHGGLKDLQDGIVSTNTEPNTLFIYNSQVLFRALRFMTRYHFMLDGQLENAYKNVDTYVDFMPSNVVYKNFTKFFNDGCACDSLVNLEKYGMLNFALPSYKNANDQEAYMCYLTKLMPILDEYDFEKMDSSEARAFIYSTLMYKRVLELAHDMDIDTAIEQALTEVTSVYMLHDEDIIRQNLYYLYDSYNIEKTAS